MLVISLLIPYGPCITSEGKTRATILNFPGLSQKRRWRDITLVIEILGEAYSLFVCGRLVNIAHR